MTPRLHKPVPLHLVLVHELIGIDANGHICSACGRVTSFPEHLAPIATTALAA